LGSDQGQQIAKSIIKWKRLIISGIDCTIAFIVIIDAHSFIYIKLFGLQ
jgi:hypothetical protein